MKELMIISVNNKGCIDSREVAERTGKKHAHLLRDIRGYKAIIDQNPNLDSEDFFIEGHYESNNKQSYNCYYLTRKGCDMVANKLTGKKGVLFTAEYVNKFEEMEKRLSSNSLIIKLDSYMIDDPIARAQRWIEERKEAESTIHMLEESKGLNSLEVTSALRAIKNKISGRISSMSSFGTTQEFAEIKRKVFENFDVKKWEDIPSYKLTDVLVFIGETKI